LKLIKSGLVFIVLAFTVTTLAGCNSEKTTNPSNELSSSSITSNKATSSPIVKLPTSAQATPSPTVKPSTGAQPSVSSGEETKFYYGTWIIKQYMPTTNVSSLSEKDINGYIGQEITIDGKQIVTNQGTIKNPIFEEKVLTSNDLLDGWRVQFSSLGIIGNTVTQVQVANYNHETGNGLGAELFFSNNNKVYTDIGGCFFELGE